MTNHISDGITHSQPKIYTCRLCKKKLTKEEYNNTQCEDVLSE